MRPAPEVILETVDRWGPELTIVALGPLTNLAAALALDARRLARAGRVVVMGGAIAVPGNITPAAEFNFYVDPEAAALVLEAGLNLELISLDVTRRVVLAQATLTERLRRCPDDRIARFILDFTLHGFAFGSEREGGGIVLHDPLAMAVALDPSLVTFEPLSVEVECEGKLTRGLSLADRREIPSHRKRAPGCRVAVSVDAARVLDLVLERLCPASA
jgi:purine nucleosidase/pyrimidine-specific ribonucleoside hydrolase